MGDPKTFEMSNVETLRRFLQEYLFQFCQEKWPIRLVRYYLGDTTVEQVLEAAQHVNPSIAHQRLCEAKFYIGAKHVMDQESEAAKKYFDDAARCHEARWVACALAQRQLESNYLASIIHKRRH